MVRRPESPAQHKRGAGLARWALAPFQGLMRPLAQLSTTRLNLRLGLSADSLTAAVLILAAIADGGLRWPWALLTVALGLWVFSFIEYAAHRWLFHGRHTGPFKRGHGHHHLDPLGYDALPFFLPPLFMGALAGLFALVLPADYALLLAGVVAAGYAAYGISHVLIHVHHFKSPRLQRWVAFHDEHHRHADKNFGVTSSLWDVILGTRYQPKARPASH
ncbi:MAG: sterol desaturase family protein [Burkholderiales bacterium]|uniref:sterol desaturase family protein n=1 Tax=Ottowia sp. TaxID=1898956 RepID=UPI001AC62E50|nr:sterol desaturase family protein [Ottowia sp.]MBN9405030.1 sterol desaturase family protein [Burkholderiales bacterium]